jgi:hypothetical protein
MIAIAVRSASLSSNFSEKFGTNEVEASKIHVDHRAGIFDSDFLVLQVIIVLEPPEENLPIPKQQEFFVIRSGTRVESRVTYLTADHRLSEQPRRAYIKDQNPVFSIPYLTRGAICGPDLRNNQQKVLIPAHIRAIYALDVRHAPPSNIPQSPSIINLAKAASLQSAFLAHNYQKSSSVTHHNNTWPVQEVASQKFLFFPRIKHIDNNSIASSVAVVFFFDIPDKVRHKPTLYTDHPLDL